MSLFLNTTTDYALTTAYDHQDIQFASHLTYFFIDCYKKNHQSSPRNGYGYVRILPLLLLFLLVTTTVLIAVRIQRERVGELRQFASGGAYATPAPVAGGVTPSVTVKPSVTVTQAPSSTTGEQPKGGYTLDMILNPDANTAAGRTGYNCAKGGCPADVEVSGFYKAPNGRYYPVASSSGPTSKDLAYVYKKVDEKINQYAQLKDKLATCTGTSCASIQSQMSQLKSDLGYTTAKLDALLQPVQVDDKKVKALEQYQTLVSKYQTCTTTPGIPSSACTQMLLAAQQYASVNGLSADERAAIDKYVKVNSIINAYVDAGLKLAQCQADGLTTCGQYSSTMKSLLNNISLTADDIKLAKDSLAQNTKISNLLNSGVTNGLTPTQIINNLVNQAGLSQTDAQKMVSQATLSMATNVMNALDSTAPGGEVAIYAQLFPKEKSSACAKDISCVQRKLQEYIHTNAPSLDAQYTNAISDLNLSRELAQAKTDTTGYAAAQLLAKLKTQYKTELSKTTNLDQAIAILNKTLPSHLQTSAVSASDIEATIRQATGQSAPKTSLQNAFDTYKSQHATPGVKLTPDKEKALQKQFEDEQLAALGRLRSELEANNTYNETLAKFYKGELIPTQLEDKLHPLVTNSQAARYAAPGTVIPKTRTGYSIINSAINGIEKTLDKVFGLSTTEAKSEAQGAIDLYGLNVTPSSQTQLEVFYKNKSVLEAAGYFRANEESETALIKQIAAGSVKVDTMVDDLGTLGKIRNSTWNAVSSIGNGFITQRINPTATNKQEQLTAQIYVQNTVMTDPTYVTTITEKIKSDPATKKAYETYQQTAPADKKNLEGFLVNQYQTALDVQDKASAKLYDAPAMQALFNGTGAEDTSWLRRAALEGTVDMQDLSVKLTDAKKVSTQAESALNTEQYRRGNNPANIAKAATVVNQANYSQAEILAEAYIKSIPKDALTTVQTNLQASLKAKNISIPVEEYQKQQLATYLNDEDVQFLMGSGGVNITMQGTLDGTYDIKRASEALASIKANDPLAAAALSLNKFEDGSLLKGQLIRDDPNASWYDRNIRAPVMMTAKPALTAVAIIVPPLRIVQLAGTALTAQTALAIAGDAMGVYMTGTSLQQTAIDCDALTAACVKSAGMTLFAASSALSSASQLNTLARTARVARLETEAGTGIIEKIARGIDTVDIGFTSATSNVLSKNPATSLLVSKADLAIADLSSFTSQAGKVPLSLEQLTAEQIRVTTALKNTVFSGAPESLGLQYARNGLGTVVFGSQAVDACSQAVDANCLTSVALAAVSFSRLSTAHMTAAAPQSTTSIAINRADQLVNISQAGVACTAAALGEASKESCMTNIMFAGLSAGQAAIRESNGTAPLMDDPFTQRTQALSDAALLGNAALDSTILFNGKQVQVTSEARTGLVADVQSRLAQATSGMAQIIGQTNQLIAARTQDKQLLGDSDENAANRTLTKAIDTWKALVNSDGTLKEFITIEGPSETADGAAPRVAVTDAMVEDAHSAITAAQRQITLENQIKADPKRSAVEKLGDNVVKLFGGDVKVMSDFESARATFVEAAKTADSNPLAYEVAAKSLEKAKTAVERSSLTAAQQKYAQQIDLAKEELSKIQDNAQLIKIRMELLEAPDRIDGALSSRLHEVRTASNDLVRAMAEQSNEAVITAAREKLARAEEVYKTVQAVKDTNATITGEGMRATMLADENAKLGPFVQSEINTNQRIAILEQSIVASGTMRGRLAEFSSSIASGKANPITEWLQGKSVRETALEARYTRAVAAQKLAEAENLKRTLTDEGKPVPSSVEKSITDLTVQFHDAEAAYDAAKTRADNSWFAKRGRSQADITIAQENIVDTLGELKVVSDDIRKEGLKVIRKADNTLAFVDGNNTEVVSAKGKAQLEKVSKYLDTLETNWTDINGKGRDLRMSGPDNAQGRADQSGIFYDALFDTQIDPASDVMGVLYNGSTGLGKSSFLLNAIADAKVSLTGSKVHVMATAWGDVEGMMRQYAPEVHSRNGVKAAYFNMTTREVTYFDGPVGGVCACGIATVRGEEAARVLREADVVYSATVETPYEFHTSRADDPLTIAFKAATKNATLLIDEFDVIAAGTRFSSGGQLQDLVSQKNPELTQKYRTMYQSDAVRNFVDTAVLTKTGKSSLELFTRTADGYALADTDVAQGMYRDMINEAARQAFDATKGTSTQTFDEFLVANKITVDDTGNPRTNSRDIVTAYDAFYKSGETPSAFKSEFGDRIGAMNAMIDHASKSTNGYGFDTRGNLVYGDGGGRLQNTRPQEVLSALALDTVGYRIQKAVLGEQLNHENVVGRIDGVTVTNQGETSTWKQILSSGHYAQRLYGFTGTPDSVVLDAKLSLGMTLKTPDPDGTSKNMIFGDTPVRAMEWHKVSALSGMKVDSLAEGQAARIVIDIKETSRELVLEHILSEARAMGSDVEVVLVNNDNNVAENKKVQVYKDGKFVSSIEGDTNGTAIEKFADQYAFGKRGNKRFILVYDQGSGRGTDIQGVFETHESTINGRKYITSTDPEYVFGSEATGTTTDVTQDIGRAREIAEKARMYLLSDTNTIINRTEALDILEANEAVSTRNALTGALRQGYDDMVKNSIDILNEISAKSNKGKAVTIQYQNKDISLGESLKLQYDKVAGVNDSLTQSSQTGVEAIDKAANRAREFINGLVNTPEFAKLSLEAREYYFENMYNEGARVAIALPDAITVESRASLQNIMNVDARTALINENIALSEVADTVSRQGRETAARSTQEQIDAITKAAAPKMDAYGERVAAETIKQAKALTERATVGTKLTTTNLYRLSLARATVSKLESSLSQAEKLKGTLESIIALSPQNTQQQQAQLAQVNTNIAQINTSLSDLGVSGRDMQRAARNDAATRLIDALEKRGVPDIRESVVGTPAYESAISAMIAYETAAAQATSVLTASSLAGNPEATIVEATQNEKKALDQAIATLLVSAAPQSEYGKLISDLALMRAAGEGTDVLLSTGREHVYSPAQKETWISIQEKQIQAIVTGVTGTSEGSFLKDGIAYQKSRVDRLVAQVRFFQGVSALWTQVSKAPRAYVQATRLSNVFSWLRNLFVRAPYTGKITVAKTPMESVILGIGNGRYADAYVMLETARTRSGRIDTAVTDLEQLEKAIRDNIATRLSQAVGRAVDANAPVVTAIMAYESAFVTAAATWNGSLDTINTTALFTAEILTVPDVAALRDSAIAAVRDFRELNLVENDRIAAATVDMVSRPMAESTYILIRSEDGRNTPPSSNAGNSTGGNSGGTTGGGTASGGQQISTQTQIVLRALQSPIAGRVTAAQTIAAAGGYDAVYRALAEVELAKRSSDIAVIQAVLGTDIRDRIAAATGKSVKQPEGDDMVAAYRAYEQRQRTEQVQQQVQAAATLPSRAPQVVAGALTTIAIAGVAGAVGLQMVAQNIGPRSPPSNVPNATVQAPPDFVYTSPFNTAVGAIDDITYRGAPSGSIEQNVPVSNQTTSQIESTDYTKYLTNASRDIATVAREELGLNEVKGDGICGPLAAQMMIDAGQLVLDASNLPNGDANPAAAIRQKFDSLNLAGGNLDDGWFLNQVMPDSKFNHISLQNGQSLLQYLEKNPLPAGTFIYMRGVTSDTNGYVAHMVRTSVDAKGRMTAVMNVQENDGTWVIKEVDLLDTLSLWQTPSGNLYRNSGMNGAEIFTPKQSVPMRDIITIETAAVNEVASIQPIVFSNQQVVRPSADMSFSALRDVSDPALQRQAIVYGVLQDFLDLQKTDAGKEEIRRVINAQPQSRSHVPAFAVPGDTYKKEPAQTLQFYVQARFASDLSSTGMDFINDPSLVAALQVLTGQFGLPRGGIVQPYQCLGVAAMMDALNAPSGSINIADMPVTDAAGIFELFGLGRDQVVGGKTWNNAFVTVEAGSIADLQDGDFIVYGNHIVPILKVYDSQFGTIVVFDQGNSPKTGTPTLGLLDFMVVDSDGFQKEIGDVNSVLVVRHAGITATAQHEQAPQSVLSLLTTSQDVASTGEGAQASTIVGGLAGLARVLTGGNAGTGPDDPVVVTVPGTGGLAGTPAEVMQKIIIAYYQLHDSTVLNKFYSGADENTVLDDISLNFAADNIIHDVEVLADRLPPDDGLVQLQRALARRDYMQAYQAYIGLQADASVHPIAYNNAIEAFHRDVAERLSTALGVTIQWNNAAISRIAEYELSVLAFTNHASQDPRNADYQAYFDTAHADPTVIAARNQALAVYDSLAAPLGITTDSYADGLRRTIDPMMTSVWSEMKLDDAIAARVDANLASQTGWFGSLWFGLGQGYRYTFGANPFKIFNSKLPAAERYGEPATWFAFRIAPLLSGNPIGIFTSTVFWAWDAVRLVTAPAQYVWAHWVHPVTTTVTTLTAPIVPADAGIPTSGLRRRIYESNIFTNGLTRQEIGKRLPMYVLTRGLLFGSTFLGGWTGPIAGYVFYQDMTFALPAQTRINIANGSREGFFEDMWNAHPFFGIGHKPWKPIYIIRDPFIFFGRYTIPVAGQLLILRDTWRAVSWPFRMIGRVISTPVAPAFPTVNPDPYTYFSTDGSITVLGFTIPRSWINATPNGNFWPFVLTRFTPISGLLNGYDWHRFIDEGGWQWMFAQPANHWSRQHNDSNRALNFWFKYFVNPRPFVGGWGETIGYIVSRSSVIGTPGLLYDGFRVIRWVREQLFHGDVPGAVQQQRVAVAPVTNPVGQSQPIITPPISNPAPATVQIQQTAVTTTHVLNGVTTGGARGVTRYFVSRTWFTIGQFFVPWFVRLPIVLGSDAIQYVWNRVNPASYQRALTSVASYPNLQGFADILSIPAGRGAYAWQSYFVSRGLFIAPWWFNGLLFTVNDIARARQWSVQHRNINQTQGTTPVQTQPQTAPIVQTAPTSVDLSGATFSDVIVPDGTILSSGMEVIARYTNTEGNLVRVPARIRGAAFSRGSWSIAVDGVNAPIIVRESQFIPQSVAEPSPAYIALNNLVADLISPMTAQQRMQELSDDMGTIGEIIGQTPTQIVNAFTQEAQQAETDALLERVREHERQIAELRALEESRQTAEFLTRNAAYQAEDWSGKYLLPVVVESISSAVVPSFEAWMDSRAVWRRMTLIRALTDGQLAAASRVSLIENNRAAMTRIEDTSFGLLDDVRLRSLVVSGASQDEIAARISELLITQGITILDFRIAVIDYETWLDNMTTIIRDVFTVEETQDQTETQDIKPSLPHVFAAAEYSGEENSIGMGIDESGIFHMGAEIAGSQVEIFYDTETDNWIIRNAPNESGVTIQDPRFFVQGATLRRTDAYRLYDGTRVQFGSSGYEAHITVNSETHTLTIVVDSVVVSSSEVTDQKPIQLLGDTNTVLPPGSYAPKDHVNDAHILTFGVQEDGSMKTDPTPEEIKQGNYAQIYFADESDPPLHAWMIRNANGDSPLEMQDAEHPHSFELQETGSYRLRNGTFIRLFNGTTARVFIDPQTNVLTIQPFKPLVLLQSYSTQDVIDAVQHYFNIDEAQVTAAITREHIDIEHMHPLVLLASLLRLLSEQHILDYSRPENFGQTFVMMSQMIEDAHVHLTGQNREILIEEVLRCLQSELSGYSDNNPSRRLLAIHVMTGIIELQNTKSNREAMREIIQNSGLPEDLKRKIFVNALTFDSPNRLIESLPESPERGRLMESFSEDAYREAIRTLSNEALFEADTKYRNNSYITWIGAIGFEWQKFDSVLNAFVKRWVPVRLRRFIPGRLYELTNNATFMPLQIHFVPFFARQNAEFDAQAVSLGMVDLARAIEKIQSIPWLVRPRTVWGMTNPTMALFAVRTLHFQLDQTLEVITPDGKKTGLDALIYIEANQNRAKARDKTIRISTRTSDLVKLMKTESIVRLLARAKRNERANRLASIMVRTVGLDTEIIRQQTRVDISEITLPTLDTPISSIEPQEQPQNLVVKSYDVIKATPPIATVYKAVLSDGRTVFIKQAESDGHWEDNAKNESAILQRLSDIPNVPHLIPGEIVGLPGSRFAFAMTEVPGIPLDLSSTSNTSADYTTQRTLINSLTTAEKLRILELAGAMIRTLRANGVNNGDFRARNFQIYRDAVGQIQFGVVDFGLGRIAENEAALLLLNRRNGDDDLSLLNNQFINLLFVSRDLTPPSIAEWHSLSPDKQTMDTFVSAIEVAKSEVSAVDALRIARFGNQIAVLPQISAPEQTLVTESIQKTDSLPRVSMAQTTLDSSALIGEPQVQTPAENPIHALWLTQSAISQDRETLQSIDEYVQRIITATTVNPEDVTALDNYIEAVFRAYYIDNTLRFAYPDTVLGRYMTTLRSLLAARTTIGDSNMTALSIAFSKLMVPVLRERLLSVARDAHDGTPVVEMDAVAFLTQIQTQIDEIVTNYARTHLKKGLFGLGGAKYSEFENPWRNLPQATQQKNGIESRSAIIGVPVEGAFGGAVGGAWFGALWTNLPGVQYWTVQLLSHPEETWNFFRVWVTDQYASLFTNTVNVYERAILRVSPEPVPACIP